ncbi:MAG: hypothetical protein RLZZ362_2498, partial [Actinomycetota bacterium]
SKFVTAGDARIEVSESPEGVHLVVKGAGETVTITGWAERPPARADDAEVHHDRSTGVWTTALTVPDRGWCRIVLRPT